LYCRLISFAVIANASHCLPRPGLPFSLRLNVFPIHWPYPKPFGTAVLASLERLPNPLALPKAFQKQTSFAFGFFNAHPLNQASLFRGFALKKPLTL
jgi:hypothetical protein